MIKQSLSWIAEKIDGVLQGDDIEISSVTTDTRAVKAGDLFIALIGDRFNGHDYILQAQEQGAAAIIASQETQTTLPVIRVADTKKALGLLGRAVKQAVAPKTIGITGSSGKTTVKEMCAAILRRRGEVLATQGNFNNDIGVPLTLLQLEPKHEYAVIEMGANHLGEVAYTTSLVNPDVATIVNATASHLEGFGSLFGVARAKSEIYKGLDDTGVAVVNMDSQFAEFWTGKVKRHKAITFSPNKYDKNADISAKEVTIGIDGCAEFLLCTPQGEIDIRLPLPGEHNVGNAMLAAALTQQVGATLEDIKDGLSGMQQVKGRLNVKQLTDQMRLLDDSYNANVASVNAAIDLLASFSGRRILILGDMAELGEKSRYYHEQVGEYAKQRGIDNLYSLGVLSQSASSIFGDNGLHHTHVEDVIHTLETTLSAEFRDITILVKGSRSSRMENVVAAIEASSLGKLERRRERLAC